MIWNQMCKGTLKEGYYTNINIHNILGISHTNNWQQLDSKGHIEYVSVHPLVALTHHFCHFHAIAYSGPQHLNQSPGCIMKDPSKFEYISQNHVELVPFRRFSDQSEEILLFLRTVLSLVGSYPFIPTVTNSRPFYFSTFTKLIPVPSRETGLLRLSSSRDIISNRSLDGAIIVYINWDKYNYFHTRDKN